MICLLWDIPCIMKIIWSGLRGGPEISPKYVAEVAPLRFSGIIEHTSLSSCGALGKTSMVKLLQYEDFLYVHQEDIVVWLINRCKLSLILSMYKLAKRINPLV